MALPGLTVADAVLGSRSPCFYSLGDSAESSLAMWCEQEQGPWRQWTRVLHVWCKQDQLWGGGGGGDRAPWPEPTPQKGLQCPDPFKPTRWPGGDPGPQNWKKRKSIGISATKVLGKIIIFPGFSQIFSPFDPKQFSPPPLAQEFI